MKPKKPTTDVYHIWPGDDNDLIDNQEINKINEVSNDLAGLAPSPVTSFMPLGASAEIEEINKKYFVETTEQQYQVLENLPVGMKDMTPKKREIY
jgi:hypothetical protein